jgi:hypothetical protein
MCSGCWGNALDAQLFGTATRLLLGLRFGVEFFSEFPAADFVCHWLLLAESIRF